MQSRDFPPYLVVIVAAIAVATAGCDSSEPESTFSGALAFSNGTDVLVAEVAPDGRVASARSVTAELPGALDSLGVPRVWRHPSWSPDGEALALLDWSAGVLGYARIVRPDGTGFRPAASAPGNPGDGDRATEPVAWSADGRFVAYNGIYGAAATGSLNVVEVATGRVVAQPLPDGFSETVAPAWAPTGSRLAVIANGLRDGRQVVFVYEVGPEGAEGRPLAELVDHPDPRKNGVRLAWSPDGRRLAAEVERGRVLRDIDVVDAATGAVVGVGPGRRPAWSPDGRRLAFDDSEGRLLVYDVERHTTKPVPTAGTLRYESLGWSGDGRHVFALTNNGPTPSPGGTPTFVDVETGARVVALAARVHSADYLAGPVPPSVR